MDMMDRIAKIVGIALSCALLVKAVLDIIQAVKGNNRHTLKK